MSKSGGPGTRYEPSVIRAGPAPMPKGGAARGVAIAQSPEVKQHSHDSTTNTK